MPADVPGLDNNANSASLVERKAKADELVALGVPVTKACRQVGLSRPTYYWLANKKGPGGDTPRADDDLTLGEDDPRSDAGRQDTSSLSRDQVA